MYVTDLNSTNGTLVNGQELSPMDNVAVEVGAEVIFGDMYLARYQLDLVSDGGAPEADNVNSGNSSGLQNSGTLVFGLEDSGDGPQRPAGSAATTAAAGGEQQGRGVERRQKKPVIRQDFQPY
jgi:hypothetical protein